MRSIGDCALDKTSRGAYRVRVRRFFGRLLQFLRNFEGLASLWDWIRSHWKWDISATALCLLGQSAMISWDIISIHWPAFVFGCVFVVFAILGFLDQREKRRIEKSRQDIRQYDVEIADAITILASTTPSRVGWDSECNFKEYVFKKLHGYMCDGELAVAGSTGALEKTHPIPKEKCQSLTPAVAIAPKGNVLYWLHSKLNDKFQADKVYMDLRVRSEDLYMIWPHAKRAEVEI